MKSIERKLVSGAALTLSLALFVQLTAPTTAAQGSDDALVAKAQKIHSRVITIDTHNDIDASLFTKDCNYTKRLTTQVNLPKMVEGGMDAAFFIVYVGQGPLTPEGYSSAYEQAIEKFDAIHRFTDEIAPQEAGLALTPADVIRQHQKHLRSIVIGVENGYPIGADLSHVAEFYKRGARYISLTHNGNNQLADSNTGEVDGYSYHDGLSPLGRQVIAEMNRLGIMVDLSHPSKGANMEAIRISKAPVIASHSGVRALAGVSRNMDDELLLAVKKNGGVAQMVAFSSYIKPDSKERTAALTKMRNDLGLGFGPGRRRAGGPAGPPPQHACPVEDPKTAAEQARRGGIGRFLDMLPPEKRAAIQKRMAEIDAQYPAAPRATVKDFVNHIDYAVKLIGIDHVGISSDFDGGGGIDGWNSAAEAFNVTLELVRRGYTEQQIGKLWGGNLLRVWSDVEKVSRQLQKQK